MNIKQVNYLIKLPSNLENRQCFLCDPMLATGGSAIYSSISMHHLMSFSKIIYIDTPLDVIIKRIGVGQERGLAVPDGISVSDVYLERKPLYEKFSQFTVDGSKSIEQLISEIKIYSNR